MTTTATVNRQFRLANRPHGPVDDDTFVLREETLPSVGEGQFLVRTIYLSIDPSLRGQLVDVPSYVPPVQIGEVMRGSGVGEVIASRNPAYRVGDLVYGPTGWQAYCLTDGTGQLRGFQTIAPGVAPRQAAGVLGTTGLTAYFGVLDVGRPVAGETVVVSGAAGATGSVAGQIAKITGCTVVGIAGTAEKCAWLTDELGFDAAINYRDERVGRRLRELCPEGVDLFFDNVGGVILDYVLLSMNVHGRVASCGTISSGYNEDTRPDPIRNYYLLAPRRIRMEGFLVSDYEHRFPEAQAELAGWLAAGKLKSRETVFEGLERAPQALRAIFEGANIGKLLVQVGAEPSHG
jgi:NADPH-dependent curcumin reductase CurA